MNSVLELIQIVEAAGGRFKIDGDRLGIFPKEAAAPVVEALRAHKKEIIDLLAQRPQIPRGVRLIEYAPKTPPVRLSEYSVVTDTERFIAATLIQLDARLRGQTWQSGNWGLQGLIDRLSACGCTVEIEDDAERA